MSPRVQTIAIAAALLLAAPASAGLPPGLEALSQSPQYRGLAARYRILDAQSADLDGDGNREYVVALAPSRPERPRGGFAVIAQRSGRWQLAWAGLYEQSRPVNLSVEGRAIRARVETPRGSAQVSLEHGRDFWFRGDEESPFRGAKLMVSSAVKGALARQYRPEHLIDGDPDTVWRTAAIGTGVGEWIQFEFPRPVDLAMVGVIGGDYRSARHWKDANRLFRFDLVAETEADRTTIVEDMDITAMLQLPTMGKRVSVVAKDQRRFKYAEIRQRKVLGLKIEAASVYLGDESNDLYVSEIEFGELLKDPAPAPADGAATPGAASGSPVAPAPVPAAAR
jgi:hypothetical protein